jgi:hypothetical protein
VIYPKLSVAASCQQKMTATCRDGFIFSPVPGPNGTVLTNAKTLHLVSQHLVETCYLGIA